MIKAFNEFIKRKNLCNKMQEIILTVSGGIDSVVMADLFYKEGYSCIILHCNFGLRGQESDADEAFVRSLAAHYDWPVYVNHFNTEEYAEREGVSIQMAARAQRYSWFDEFATEREMPLIATAHNMNDTVETVLLNMSRGTGIKGLTGIPVHNGKYIRPLLFSSRKEIISYAKEQNLSYREDSSNASTKYQRNKIRHDIIPQLEQVNASFIQTMYENIHRFSESYSVFRQKIEEERSNLLVEKDDHYEIDIARLTTLNPISTWLYELFTEYGFTRDQCLNLENILDADSGKQFISPTHRIFKDRNKLLLFRSEETVFERYYIDSPGDDAALPFPMDIECITGMHQDEIPRQANIACLDLKKLNFPLTLRKWQHGDYFIPLGMQHMKKVSDFFIDMKVPVPVKNKTWLLCSGKHIVWIMGLRIDNRYRISEETEEVLKLEIYL